MKLLLFFFLPFGLDDYDFALWVELMLYCFRSHSNLLCLILSPVKIDDLFIVALGTFGYWSIAFELECLASINSSQVEMAFYSLVGYLSGQSIAICFF